MWVGSYLAFLSFLSGGEKVKMSSPSRSSLNKPELLDGFLAALGGSVGMVSVG